MVESLSGRVLYGPDIRRARRSSHQLYKGAVLNPVRDIGERYRNRLHLARLKVADSLAGKEA